MADKSPSKAGSQGIELESEFLISLLPEGRWPKLQSRSLGAILRCQRAGKTVSSCKLPCREAMLPALVRCRSHTIASDVV